MTKFRVGVVTVVEVDAVDWRDAVNVAEGAVKHAIQQVDVGDDRFALVQWRHYNGLNYAAKVVGDPAELSVALHLGYVCLQVKQPVEDGASVGCPCECNGGGFCGGCGHAGCGGRR